MREAGTAEVTRYFEYYKSMGFFVGQTFPQISALRDDFDDVEQGPSEIFDNPTRPYTKGLFAAALELR